METNISIPNPIFEIAKNLAKELNISLGELYPLALKDYARAFEKEKDITAQLNEVYKTEDSSIDKELILMQIASLTSQEHHAFVEETYGGLASDPIKRGSQGEFEIREAII